MSEEKRKPQSQSFGCFCTLAYFSAISLSLSLMASTSFLLIAYTWALSVAICTVFMAVLQPHVPMHFYAGQLPLFSSYNSLGFNIHIASPQQGQMNNYIWINNMWLPPVSLVKSCYSKYAFAWIHAAEIFLHLHAATCNCWCTWRSSSIGIMSLLVYHFKHQPMHASYM